MFFDQPPPQHSLGEEYLGIAAAQGQGSHPMHSGQPIMPIFKRKSAPSQMEIQAHAKKRK
jgi:hypothetical protein